MLLNLRNIKTKRWFVSQQEFHKLSGIAFQILGQIQLATSAFFHDGSWIARLMLILKWSKATNHLANENANAPDISLVSMTSIQHHLRSTVSWRTAVSISLIPADISNLLCKTKINELDMPFLV